MSNRKKMAKEAAKAAKKARGGAKKAKGGVNFSAPDVANAVRGNPYLQRLIEDADLRDSVREAIDATRSVYERLTNGKTTVKSLVEDKRLQGDIQDAVDAIREVTTGLTEPSYKRAARKRFGFGRLLLLLGIGGGVAVGVNEGLRKKVLDMLFGAEEEFNYTPPATAGGSSAPAPTASPVSAA